MSNLIPRVGVGVLLYYPSEGIVWLYRQGTSHGNNEWSFPGGRLEFMQSLETCAVNETLEETGVEVADLKRLDFITEDVFPVENQHWITHYFIAKPKPYQRPRLMEPHKASQLIVSWEPPIGEAVFSGADKATDYFNRMGAKYLYRW